MTQSQSTLIQSLENQTGFHRDKVPGFKEAVESVLRLPFDKDFSVRLSEQFCQFQGFHIVQFSKIISFINILCVTGCLNFQSEVEKVLEMYQRKEVTMDVSDFLEIVLGILSSEEATENTLCSLDGIVTDLSILYNELAGAGAVDLRETVETHNFNYSPEYYHSRRTFFECYDILKQRLHKKNGHVMITSTVSLLRVEKARKGLGDPHSCNRGLILKAWLKLLRTSFVSNNLAILVAEMEQDHCDRAVELFGNHQSDPGDQCPKTGYPIILPEVVAAIDKLNGHAKDRECEDDVVFQMMRVPASFDTNLSDCTETTASPAQREERWKMLLNAAAWWKQFPLELTKLLFNTSLSNKDFELILRVQSNESDIVTCVVNLLKRTDVPKEKEEGERARRKTKCDFIRIFFVLLSSFQNRIDVFQKLADDLVKCSSKVTADELEVMVNALLAVTESSTVGVEALWQVLVLISCSDGIGDKAELWGRYLKLYLPLRSSDQEMFLLLGKALALLSGENALLLLDQVQPGSQCVRFICSQMIFFNGFLDGDVNNHYSVMSPIIQDNAVKEKIIEPLKKINETIKVFKHSQTLLPKDMRSSIPGSAYNALVVAIAGSMAVKTYRAIIDDRVRECVTAALFSTSEPTEVIRLYLKVKCLLVRAWSFSLISHGQRTAMVVKAPMLLPIPGLLSEVWMNTFVQGTATLLSGKSCDSQKMLLLTAFYKAVCRDWLDGYQELQNAMECLNVSVEQNECTEYRNSVFQFMEELLKIPNILRVLGKGVGLLRFLPVPVKIPLTSLIIKRFPESIKTKEALQVFHFLAELSKTNYFQLLTQIGLAAVLSLSEMQNVLQELNIVIRILRNTPTDSLAQVTDCLVAAYDCGLTKGERQLLFREVEEVKGISMQIVRIVRIVRTPFNMCALFVKGWQKSSDLQVLRDKLRYIMSHFDEDARFSNTYTRHMELFSKELHWLLLETNLSPRDIVLCFRLCSPSFDQDNAVLQKDGRSWLSNVRTGINENVEFPSPIRVAYTFLVTLRSSFGENRVKEWMIENLLRAVFKKDSCMVQATSADGTPPKERSRTAKEAISDALALISLCTSVNQLMLWLENPFLLTCQHAMTVVLGACKWRRVEEDTDLKSRMDISRKCKFSLEKAMETERVHPCLRDTPATFLHTILQFNLKCNLCAKLVDLFHRHATAAIACGTIVSQWQSSEQGMELLENFISLSPGETCKLPNIDDDSFEFTCLSILSSRPGLESAEPVFRLWNELHAQRKLGEHHPLLKAIGWTVEVAQSKIDPAVVASWLTIFHAAKLRWNEVNIVTSLTSKSADLLIPGSQNINECLFTSGTVNKILVNGEVNISELKYYLTLARILYEALIIAQRLEKENSPHSAAVIATLQETSKKLCESAKERDAKSSTSDQPQSQDTPQTSMTELYIHGQYLKTVFIDMFGGCESSAIDAGSPFWEKSNRPDSVLVLLRRWLAAAAYHTKMPVWKDHIDHIFSIIVHSNSPAKGSQHGPDDIQRSAHSPCSDAAIVSSTASSTNESAPLLAGSADIVQGPGDDSRTLRTTRPVPATSTGFTTEAALQSVTDVQPRAVTRSTSLRTPVRFFNLVLGLLRWQETVFWRAKSLMFFWRSKAPNSQEVRPFDARTVGNQSKFHLDPSLLSIEMAGCGTRPNAREELASPSNLVDNTHNGRQVAECPKWTQMVQDYVVNLKDNQACIARLQSVGYNQGTADLWRDPCLKLTRVIRKRQNVRNLEERYRIHKHICSEYLALLKELKIESIDIDGKPKQLRELFSRDLSLEELDQQIYAVRINLRESQDSHVQAKCQPVFQLEDERRGYIKILRKQSIQESKKKAVKQQDAKTFTIVWENRFFEAIRLCSETIPECYAPNGFHSHKPIQCALCADSQIISVFEGKEEVENVEVKLLEAGMFVYGLHRGRYEMITDELWAEFYKFLLEERLVPKIILSRNSPAFEWARRLVGNEGEEKLDASKMKFHETVVPMEESYYDDYPRFEVENGKDVYTAALTLTADNVQRFDLKLQDPLHNGAKEKQTLGDEVISALRSKLLERFDAESESTLTKRLAGRVRKVCCRVIKDKLSKSEVESNLKKEINEKKLYENGIVGKVGIEWFVQTIAELINEKKQRQDT